MAKAMLLGPMVLVLTQFETVGKPIEQCATWWFCSLYRAHIFIGRIVSPVRYVGRKLLKVPAVCACTHICQEKHG